MNTYDRIVTKLPLKNLWDDDGPLEAKKGRELTERDLKILLCDPLLAFVVADAGRRLTWIDPAERFAFWKMEVQPHLYAPTRPRLEDYPGEYFYFAYEWSLRASVAVVLEMSH